MIDPLAEVVGLLQPAARYSKSVVGAGPWRVSRSDAGQPFYCAVLEGGCRLALDGAEPIALQAGDFVLIPATHGIVMSSLQPPEGTAQSVPAELGDGIFRIGARHGPTDLRIVAGHCSFGSPDAALLVPLLPQLIHVRDEPRLATLVQLVREESRTQRPARDVVLSRLLEVLLIEALRSTSGTGASPGLARALADPRLAAAIRAMHARPDHVWTVRDLAGEAALSRSVFFERFNRAMGMAPMEYLLTWRMALARQLLRSGDLAIDDVAERVGYGSASTFSVAFARRTGIPPARYARMAAQNGEAGDNRLLRPLTEL